MASIAPTARMKGRRMGAAAAPLVNPLEYVELHVRAEGGEDAAAPLHPWEDVYQVFVDIGLVVSESVRQREEPAEVHFALWSEAAGRFVSEPYVYRADKRAAYVGGQHTEANFFFQDVDAELVRGGGLYIVGRLYRVGAVRESGGGQALRARRPVGVFIDELRVSRALALLGRPHDVTLALCRTKRHETDFPFLHRHAIAGDDRALYEQLSDNKEFVAASVTLYAGAAERALEQRSAAGAASKSSRVSGRWLGADPAMRLSPSPAGHRNELYVTLVGGRYEYSGKSSEKNVEALLRVRRADGSTVRDAILIGRGTVERVEGEYRTAVFYHSNRPGFDETVRLDLDRIDDPRTCHLLIESSHMSARSNSAVASSFSFLPLATPDGAIVADGEHTLEGLVAGAEANEMSYLIGGGQSTRESFRVRTRLCSTEETQSATLHRVMGLPAAPSSTAAASAALAKFVDATPACVAVYSRRVLGSILTILEDESDGAPGEDALRALVCAVHAIPEGLLDVYLASAAFKNRRARPTAHSRVHALMPACVDVAAPGSAALLAKLARALPRVIRIVLRSHELAAAAGPAGLAPIVRGLVDCVGKALSRVAAHEAGAVADMVPLLAAEVEPVLGPGDAGAAVAGLVRHALQAQGLGPGDDDAGASSQLVALRLNAVRLVLHGPVGRAEAGREVLARLVDGELRFVAAPALIGLHSLSVAVARRLLLGAGDGRAAVARSLARHVPAIADAAATLQRVANGGGAGELVPPPGPASEACSTSVLLDTVTLLWGVLSGLDSRDELAGAMASCSVRSTNEVVLQVLGVSTRAMTGAPSTYGPRGWLDASAAEAAVIVHTLSALAHMLMSGLDGTAPPHLIDAWFGASLAAVRARDLDPGGRDRARERLVTDMEMVWAAHGDLRRAMSAWGATLVTPLVTMLDGTGPARAVRDFALSVLVDIVRGGGKDVQWHALCALYDLEVRSEPAASQALLALEAATAEEAPEFAAHVKTGFQLIRRRLRHVLQLAAGRQLPVNDDATELVTFLEKHDPSSAAAGQRTGVGFAVRFEKLDLGRAAQPLVKAAASGKDDAIAALFAAGADGAGTAPSDDTAAALVLAASNGHASTVELLLVLYADALDRRVREDAKEAADRSGHPVAAAVVQGTVDVLAVRQCRTADGAGPAHRAAALGRDRSLRALLAADVRLADTVASGTGMRPLHYAARFGQYGAALALLEHGATSDAAALEDARSRGHARVVRLLGACELRCELQDGEAVVALAARKPEVLLVWPYDSFPDGFQPVPRDAYLAAVLRVARGCPHATALHLHAGAVAAGAAAFVRLALDRLRERPHDAPAYELHVHGPAPPPDAVWSLPSLDTVCVSGGAEAGEGALLRLFRSAAAPSASIRSLRVSGVDVPVREYRLDLRSIPPALTRALLAIPGDEGVRLLLDHLLMGSTGGLRSFGYAPEADDRACAGAASVWARLKPVVDRLAEGSGVSLRELSLDSAGVSDEDAGSLAELFTGLTHLSLAGNSIGSAGASALLELVRLHNVEHMDLRRNSIRSLDLGYLLSKASSEENDDDFRGRLLRLRLLLDGNPLPPSVLPPRAVSDPKYLAGYLVDMWRGSMPLSRVAIKLVGGGGAGKTTTRLRLFGGGRLLSADLDTWTHSEAAEWARLAQLPRKVIRFLAGSPHVTGRTLKDPEGLDKVQREMATKLNESSASRFRTACDKMVAKAAAADTSDENNFLYVSTPGLAMAEQPHKLVLTGDERKRLQKARKEKAISPWRALTRVIGLTSKDKEASIEVDVADFAGQVEFFVLHRAFLHSAHAVHVVCVNLHEHGQMFAVDRDKKGLSDVERVVERAVYWVHEVRRLVLSRNGAASSWPAAEQVRVVVALTFADQQPHKAEPIRLEVIKALRKAFGWFDAADVLLVKASDQVVPETDPLYRAIARHAVSLAKSVIVPKSYADGRKCLQELAEGCVQRRQALVMRRDDVLSELERKVGSEEVGKRCLAFFADSLDVIETEHLVALQPLRWLPRAMQLFAWDVGRTASELGQYQWRELAGVYSRATVVRETSHNELLIGELCGDHVSLKGDHERELEDACRAADLAVDMLLELRCCFSVREGAAPVSVPGRDGGNVVTNYDRSNGDMLLVFPSALTTAHPLPERVASWSESRGARSCFVAAASLALEGGAEVSPSALPLLQIDLARVQPRATLECGFDTFKVTYDDEHRSELLVFCAPDRRSIELWTRSPGREAARTVLEEAVAAARAELGSDIPCRRVPLCPACVLEGRSAAAAVVAPAPSAAPSAGRAAADSSRRRCVKCSLVWADTELDGGGVPFVAGVEPGVCLALRGLAHDGNGVALEPLERPVFAVHDGTEAAAEGARALRRTLEELGVAESGLPGAAVAFYGGASDPPVPFKRAVLAALQSAPARAFETRVLRWKLPPDGAAQSRDTPAPLAELLRKDGAELRDLREAVRWAHGLWRPGALGGIRGEELTMAMRMARVELAGGTAQAQTTGPLPEEDLVSEWMDLTLVHRRLEEPRGGYPFFGQKFLVFHSHCSRDTKPLARAATVALEQLGVASFFDAKDLPGCSLGQGISHALASAHVTVIWLSEHFPEHPWCKREVLAALEWPKQHENSQLKHLEVYVDVEPGVVPRALRNRVGLKLGPHTDGPQVLDLLTRVTRHTFLLVRAMEPNEEKLERAVAAGVRKVHNEPKENEHPAARARAQVAAAYAALS